MRSKLLIAMSFFGFLTSCAPASQDVVSRLGDSPVVTGGTFTSGGGLSVAAELRESEGQTLVCGVWAQSRQQSILTKGKAQRVINTGSIFIGRERVVQNFLFMNEVDPSASYAGKESGCLLLDRAWSASDAQQTPLVRIPRQVVHKEIDEAGGLIVYFVDTGRPEAGS